MAEQLGINNTEQKMISGQVQENYDAQPVVQAVSSDDSVVVNASEKRYLWTARAFAVVTAISFCCNLILLLTIANLLPLYRIEPYLLTLSSKEEQVYNVIPYTRNMETQKAITETFVSKYILIRTTLLSDIEEMEARWKNGGDLQEMSSAKVYQDFVNSTGRKLMQRMKQEGLTSHVKILTVNEVDNGIWQVEYTVDYYLPTSFQPKTIKYRSTLKVQYQRRPVQFKERLKNPTGFKVVSYSIKQIKE